MVMRSFLGDFCGPRIPSFCLSEAGSSVAALKRAGSTSDDFLNSKAQDNVILDKPCACLPKFLLN